MLVIKTVKRMMMMTMMTLIREGGRYTRKG